MHCSQLHYRSHHVLPSLRRPPPPPPLRRSKTLIPPPPRNQRIPLLLPSWRRSPLPFLSRSSSPYAPDELPVGDDDDARYLERFRPREKESEDEARRRNWIERGWAPWEEILTPEADFARKSLNEGVEGEVPLQSPEAVEAFKMLRPSYRRKRMEESGLSEEEYLAKQFAIKGEIPDPLETSWAGPVAVRMVPPRDWPPRDWQVDAAELEFMQEAHKLQAERVDLDAEVCTDVDNMCLERYHVFVKQYKEWVAANQEKLEEESYKFDQDYYPGRRKRGKDYKDDMLELPFIYPGQLWQLHNAEQMILDHEEENPDKYQDKKYESTIDTAFDEENSVEYTQAYYKKALLPKVILLWQLHNAEQMILDHEEENPDKYQDKKYESTIDTAFDEENSVEYTQAYYKKALLPKVILLHNRLKKEAKERGEEYKIPKLRRNIEMDQYDLMHWRRSLEEREALMRDISCRKALGLPLEEPGRYVDDKRVWGQDRYDPSDPLYRYDYWGEPKNSEKSKQERMTEDHNQSIVGKGTVWYEMSYEEAIKQKMRHEAQMKATPEEREESGDEDDEDDDIDFDYSIFGSSNSYSTNKPVVNGTESPSIRKALGLPLEEPGRYVDDKRVWGQDRYDPSDPLYRYDYWGEPKNSEKSKQERMTEDHNQSIVGKGTVWYEMSYEEAIKQKMRHEAQMKATPEEREESGDEDDEDDDIDFDYSIFGSSNSYSTNKPVVNGTESPSMSDEGMFEN
ncbi:putative protein tex [Cocos nucifera]|uniref:Protein PLASTID TRANSCRIPTIONALLY ACTIVE 10 n=1 Tax=Cocos nucifera TaxID=13894 RepID=A0A8K0IN95_COCNU|nr:putative protein tex [Cocos nucifera]